MSHKKTNGIIGFLSSNCIWQTPFYWFWSHLKFDIFYLPLTWPSVKPSKNVLGQPNGYHNRNMWSKGPENLCHITCILFQNVRDLLWPSYDLKYTLCMLDTPRVRSIWNKKWCDHIWAWSDVFTDRQSPKWKHAPYVNNFEFDLTCDVIGDLEVNNNRFRSTVLAGLSKAAWILKIGPVVSEMGGGL